MKDGLVQAETWEFEEASAMDTMDFMDDMDFGYWLGDACLVLGRGLGRGAGVDGWNAVDCRSRPGLHRNDGSEVRHAQDKPGGVC